MDERQYEPIRRYFDEIELARMKNELVTKVGEVKMLRGNKTQSLTEMTSCIKATEKAVYDLQEKVSLGYEVVNVEIFTLLDTPRPGIKRIVRTDNNEMLREEPMSLRERQANFDFQGPGGEAEK